jgi:hypothetical protein
MFISNAYASAAGAPQGGGTMELIFMLAIFGPPLPSPALKLVDGQAQLARSSSSTRRMEAAGRPRACGPRSRADPAPEARYPAVRHLRVPRLVHLDLHIQTD